MAHEEILGSNAFGVTEKENGTPPGEFPGEPGSGPDSGPTSDANTEPTLKDPIQPGYNSSMLDPDAEGTDWASIAQQAKSNLDTATTRRAEAAQSKLLRRATAAAVAISPAPVNPYPKLGPRMIRGWEYRLMRVLHGI